MPLLLLDHFLLLPNLSNGVWVSSRVAKLWNLPYFSAKFIIFLKTNSRSNRTIASKNEKPRETEATRGSEQPWLSQPPQPVVGSGRPYSPTSRTLCFILYLRLWVLPWIIHVGPIGILFAKSHHFVWPNPHAFLLILGLIYVNLQ